MAHKEKNTNYIKNDALTNYGHRKITIIKYNSVFLFLTFRSSVLKKPNIKKHIISLIQRNHINPPDNEKGRANDEMYIVLFCNTFVSLIDFKHYKKISIGGDDVHYDGGNFIPEAFYEVQ